MRVGFFAACVASAFSVLCLGLSGCSKEGNTQIPPNPNAQVFTDEERQKYNEEQTNMMIPKE